MGVSGIPSTPIPHIGRQYLAENTSGPEEGIKGVAEDVKGTATEAVGTVTDATISSRQPGSPSGETPLRGARPEFRLGPLGGGPVSIRAASIRTVSIRTCVDQDLRGVLR